MQISLQVIISILSLVMMFSSLVISIKHQINDGSNSLLLSNKERKLDKRGLFDFFKPKGGDGGFPFFSSSSHGGGKHKNKHKGEHHEYDDYHSDHIIDVHNDHHINHVVHHHDHHVLHDHDHHIHHEHEHHFEPEYKHHGDHYDNHLPIIAIPTQHHHIDHHVHHHEGTHKVLVTVDHHGADIVNDHHKIHEYSNIGGDVSHFGKHAGVLDLNYDSFGHEVGLFYPQQTSYHSQ